MTSKTDALYEELLRRRVIRFDEIMSLAKELFGRSLSRAYVNRKYVQRLVKAGRIKTIRRGLYIALSPIEDEPQVDKLLVASKIRPNYFLGFHTALEFYGCAYSSRNEAYTCVKPESRFDPFEFRGYTFRPVFVDDVTFEVEEKEYRGHTVRVSSKERAFVDCLDRVESAGGWEEALKSLQNLGGLDFEKVVEIVSRDKSRILLRKTGLVLDLLKKSSLFYEHLPEKILHDLEQRISGPPRYLVRDMPGSLNPRWRLYIPQKFEENLRGV